MKNIFDLRGAQGDSEVKIPMDYIRNEIKKTRRHLVNLL
ncbi:hypothetical protein [Escherichia phage F2]|uniref:Uncharacterized protein n=1 Tax=Escherichia phage F2 TaxID=2696339 RepID=A0A6G6XGY8_9CAUD|nr:hypothetical protein KMC05_gp038 [Escherichia phage F2]QIG57372.1 hypothetical protein [Escherichia phage F2]